MKDIKEDLYNLGEELTAIEKRINEAEILPENKEHILKFERNSLVCGERGIIRTIINMRMLKLFAEKCNKNLADLSKDDINDVLLRLKAKQKDATVDMIISTLRVFYRFIENLEKGEISQRIKHLKMKRTVNTLRREDLASEQDLTKMIQKVQSERNGTIYAAMFALQYEAALRPGELRGIQLKNITKTQYGFKILTTGKTGEKTIYAIMSAPLIEKLLLGHKFKDNGEAPLFYFEANGKPVFIQQGAYIRRISISFLDISKKFVVTDI